MLVPFVIDADSLAPDPAWPPPVVRKCHYDLLDIWQRIGLLVHDADTFDDSSLARAVEALPQNLRLLWQGVLERCPPVPCLNGWIGAVTPGCVDELCSFASLALVDDDHAEGDFGMTEDQDETLIGPGITHRLVVSRLLAANRASVMQEALAISQRSIQAGERYQNIWGSRFRSLASSSSPVLKQVAIVDRYTVEQHFRCPQQWLSGLERFLHELDKDAGGARYVTVYSAWTEKLAEKTDKDVESEIAALMDRLPKANIKRLKVNMVPNHVFGTYARDRYVRFGRYVWELGHGLDIFQGPASRHLCQASFKSEADGYLDIEQELERHAKPCSIRTRS